MAAVQDVETAALRFDAVSRRFFIGACAAAPIAAALPAVAWAGGRLSEYSGAVAIDSHRVVTGHYIRPRRASNMDVVVVVSASGIPDPASIALARQHAVSGVIAVVPDLARTYPAAAIAGRSAAVAMLRRDLPRWQGHALGSGRVTLVQA